MTNQFILDLENSIHGIHTRLKELHYSSPSFSLHKIIDEFDKEFLEFEDAIMENAQAIWGFIEPGDLKPKLPNSMEIEELLEDIRGLLVTIKKKAGNDMMWTGIINRTDDFFETVNSYIYQVRIAKHETQE